MSSPAVPGRLNALAASIRHPRSAGQLVLRTAGFNMVSLLTGAIAGIILTRVGGPTVRGEYAGVMAWFGISLAIGDLGQPAALCFYVASDPGQAREYVATSRAMMMLTGTLAVAAGILLAPLLARGNLEVAVGYRIAFAGSIVAYAGVSYIFALQAADLERWNVVRITQPAITLIFYLVLWPLHLLSLPTAVLVLTATTLMQTTWAYHCCRRAGLAPGRVRLSLVKPLAAYGTAQLAAIAPASLNIKLDQVILSQVVGAADLGRYAVAVSLTVLPVPVICAIGYVAFPKLAAQDEVNASTVRLERRALLGSAGLAAAVLIPLAVMSRWLVPEVYGASYRGAVPLVWILAPGSFFLACGQVAGDLLRGRKNPGLVAWAQGIAAIIAISMIFTLVPLMGINGAAVASTVAYGIAFAAMLLSLARLPGKTRRRSDTMSRDCCHGMTRQ